MVYRIVAGGIHIESSTFTPYISSFGDFEIRRGEELLKRYPWYDEYKNRAQILPLVHARALPGGVVSREFFEEWMNEFKCALQKQMEHGGIDGVLFDIHGAMSVQDMEDAEGFIAKEIRSIVGENVLISTAMDLHGNVSDDLFEMSDLITCYRTAPHIDTDETRERAFFNLLKALDQKQKRLFKSKVDLPILLPGEKTSTQVSPGRELYEMIYDLTDQEDVLDLSIWMGFPWADEKRCHAVVVAVGFDEQKVESATLKVAQRFWEIRETFEFVGPTDTLQNAVLQSLEFEDKPFFISDTGDNPGAGGVGDMNLVLKEFIRCLETKSTHKKILFASIFDKESIDVIYAAKSHLEQNDELKKKEKRGEGIKLLLGAKADPSFGEPVELEVTVEHLFYDKRARRGALVRSGNLSILITESRFQYGNFESYVNSGVSSFEEYDIIIVKMGYLEPDLSKAAKGWVMALTPGAVSQDIVNLDFHHLKRPLFPFDQEKIDLEVKSLQK